MFKRYKLSKLDIIVLTLILGTIAIITGYKFLFHTLSSIIIYHLFLICTGVIQGLPKLPSGLRLASSR